MGDDFAETRRPARALSRRLVLAAALGLAAGPARAQPTGYLFEAIDPYPRRQVGVELKVRIRDAAGRPQHGATILEASLDKSPDGQPGAYAPVIVLPSAEHGVYAFKTDLNTDGRYLLTVRARLMGVAQPVSGTVLFTTPAPKPTLPPAVSPARKPVQKPAT